MPIEGSVWSHHLSGNTGRVLTLRVLKWDGKIARGKIFKFNKTDSHGEKPYQLGYLILTDIELI